MEIQYIYDAKGKQVGVMIPVELWNKMKHKMIPKKELIPSRYRGIYKNLSINLEQEIKSLYTNRCMQ